ncbi:hypothetical protein [Rhizohabitans arisaemae]|uniref:hypothetical protein n=1 Tax=Rhizohabitans arisaemae TaxID=2720610 RepID=UPI0024B04D18|nr:hypothetical protein [Rhizohabitans arisaemae]
MPEIAGKVVHIAVSPPGGKAQLDEWDRQASRRASQGYTVTDPPDGHPTHRVCPYCVSQAVVVGRPQFSAPVTDSGKPSQVDVWGGL